MTTGTAYFYQLRGSLSSGEFPLLSQNQDLSSKLKHSVTVKYAKGLQTRITIPHVTGIEQANVVELDGLFYWITAYNESTTYNGSMTFLLDFMGPTSFFRKNDTAKGAWNRLPTNSTPYIKNEMTDDVRVIDDSTDNIGDRLYKTVGDVKTYMYFWQVSGYDQNNNVARYGGFFWYNNKSLSTSHVQGGLYVDGTDDGNYPDFEDLFKDMDACVGILPENVIDFSISQRLPFKVDEEIINGRVVFRFVDASNNTIAPTKNGTGNAYSYDLGNVQGSMVPVDKDTTLTMNARQRSTGQISVIDWNGNAIMNIPTQMADSNTIKINCKTICDISGIYSIITCGDIQLSLTEGRLPYNSNTWATYKAYQMDTDRISMENTIRFAEFSRDTQRQSGIFDAVSSGAQTGIMTGIMAGNPAAALVGIPFGAMDWMVGDWQNDRALNLTKMQARADFELSKKKAIDQPQTSYNAGYGFIYCILNELRPLKLAVSTPLHLTNTIYTNWTDNYGYPVEGVFDASITNGYYQGKLICNADAQTGMLWDECNKVFMTGFKFITP